jgi:serine/threonine protein kinase
VVARHARRYGVRRVWVGLKVSHPNLLPILSAGVEQPPFYLVSPKLEGRSLAAILEQQRRLPLAITLWIVRHVAEALDALPPTARMVHADVKPANIVVAPDGHATLVIPVSSTRRTKAATGRRGRCTARSTIWRPKRSPRRWLPHRRATCIAWA